MENILGESLKLFFILVYFHLINYTLLFRKYWHSLTKLLSIENVLEKGWNYFTLFNFTYSVDLKKSWRTWREYIRVFYLAVSEWREPRLEHPRCHHMKLHNGIATSAMFNFHKPFLSELKYTDLGEWSELRKASLYCNRLWNRSQNDLDVDILEILWLSA